MKKQSILAIGLIAVTVVLGAVSFILLPDTVVTQFGSSGNVTAMPKPLAVLLPLALGIGGAAVSLASKAEGDGKKKPLFVSGIGILVLAVMLIVNL